MSGLLLIVVAKATLEVALLMLLGRAALGLLPGMDEERRRGNFIYRLFDLGARPPLLAARVLLPRVFAGRWLPLAAAVLLLGLWCALVAAKWQACQDAPGAAACRPAATVPSSTSPR